MKNILIVMTLLVAATLGACAQAQTNIRPKHSTWASKRPMPEWAKHDSPWQEGKFVYATGRAGTEVREMDIRMRIAEFNGKRLLMSVGACRSSFIGGFLDETWVAPDETVYALIHAEAEIVLEKC